ncbi:hypothetical protein BU24DRAFT_387829 [Aaosphaeria arxii CBS 175.79]|uniref:Peptidase M14 domain-containing protein n=1 Tax=Aaosphaeria arxii CBS 175.79 TaxID=1450172 RepID=A0A6A5XVI6_9PLEO|nr:uncharacterized protein BU24DRAFT_387829 [Aaosphaeria arxii CBS 175.79]KAF2016953.1 hypothetical protein BU24DRAFT_387829 [Aaosphaeria arxii CBS 175.79]
MKSILLSAFLLPLALSSVVPRAEEKIDYHGFKILRVNVPKGAKDVESKIQELSAHILNPGKSALVDVVVSPENLKALEALSLESTVLTEDVGAVLDEEGPISTYAGFATWFTAYHSYADHIQFLRDLQGGYTSQSEVITIGNSVQGRALTGIHIWGSGGKGSKPAVLFHGTVHAREWISTMTTEYLAYQLLTKYASDTTVKALVDKFDFYIIPIVNPDGFVYTQTTDRLWRKNRQTVSTSTCVGRDNNRNWPYKWEVTGGASTNPCSETFKGLAASDAPENRAMVSHVNSLRDGRGLRLYLDIHSYGQYILWPYGYTCSGVVENDAQHRSIASRAAAAIRAISGTAYTIGPACSTLYATTGDSTDYTDAVGNATYSYTYELRDRGTYGFSLPASQIQPTVVETWAGVLSMLKDL